MAKYSGIAAWNGNHYMRGDEVSGSKIEWRDDGMYLYDDEERYISGFGDMTRYEWVEIFEKSLKEVE